MTGQTRTTTRDALHDRVIAEAADNLIDGGYDVGTNAGHAKRFAFADDLYPDLIVGELVEAGAARAPALVSFSVIVLRRGQTGLPQMRNVIDVNEMEGDVCFSIRIEHDAIGSSLHGQYLNRRPRNQTRWSEWIEHDVDAQAVGDRVHELLANPSTSSHHKPRFASRIPSRPSERPEQTTRWIMEITTVRVQVFLERNERFFDLMLA